MGLVSWPVRVQGSRRHWDSAFEGSTAALVGRTLPGLTLCLWTQCDLWGEMTLKLNEVYTASGTEPNFRRFQRPHVWKPSKVLLKTRDPAPVRQGSASQTLVKDLVFFLSTPSHSLVKLNTNEFTET